PDHLGHVIFITAAAAMGGVHIRNHSTLKNAARAAMPAPDHPRAPPRPPPRATPPPAPPPC
ncbi:hypothetical protein ACFV0W_04860, partial [Streptomyces anulatus]